MILGTEPHGAVRGLENLNDSKPLQPFWAEDVFNSFSILIENENAGPDGARPDPSVSGLNGACK